MHIRADHLLMCSHTLRIKILVAVKVTTRHVVSRLETDPTPVVDDKWSEQALHWVSTDG